jgi:hypothetical protein
MLLSLANKRRRHKKNVNSTHCTTTFRRKQVVNFMPDSFTLCKVPISAVDESRLTSQSVWPDKEENTGDVRTTLYFGAFV